MSTFTNPSDTAPEAAVAYTSAILELLGDRDPLAVLRETPKNLRLRASSQPVDVLRRPEGPGRWSVVAVLQHLADSEIAWAWRLRCTLAQDRPELSGYDQDAWASSLGYQDTDPDDALEQFDVLRRSHLRLVAGLGPDHLNRVGVHRERGDESVGHMIRLYAGHDLVHLKQIDRILSSVG